MRPLILASLLAAGGAQAQPMDAGQAGTPSDWMRCDGFPRPGGPAEQVAGLLKSPPSWQTSHRVNQAPVINAHASGRDAVAACDRLLADPLAQRDWQRAVTLNHARAIHLFVAGADAGVAAQTDRVRAAAGPHAADPVFQRGNGVSLRMLDGAARIAANAPDAPGIVAAAADARPFEPALQWAALMALNRPRIGDAAREPIEARLLALSPNAPVSLARLAAARGDWAAAARWSALNVRTLAAGPPRLQRPLTEPRGREPSHGTPLFDHLNGVAHAAVDAASYAVRTGDRPGAQAMLQVAAQALLDMRGKGSVSLTRLVRRGHDSAFAWSTGVLTEMLGSRIAELAHTVAAGAQAPMPPPQTLDAWRVTLATSLLQAHGFPQAGWHGASLGAPASGTARERGDRADGGTPFRVARFESGDAPAAVVFEAALLRAARAAASLGHDRFTVVQQQSMAEITTTCVEGKTVSERESARIAEIAYVPWTAAAGPPAAPGVAPERMAFALDVAAVRAALEPALAPPANR